MEAVDLALIRRHHPHLIEFIGLAAGHQQHLVFACNLAADHTEVNNHAPVWVVIGIKNQRPQGLLQPTGGRWHPIHHSLQNLGNTQTRLSRTGNGIGGVKPDDRFNLLPDALRIGTR